MTDGQLTLNYPSFNSRVLASTIDLLIIMLIAYPVISMLNAHMFTPIDISSIIITQPSSSQTLGQSHPGAQPLTIDYPMLFEILRKNWVQLVFANSMQILFIAVYEIFFWARFSATPGKMLFKMRIQNISDGSPISLTKAILRFIGYMLSGVIFTLGFIWVLFNKQHRGWHDYLAGTVVIKKTKGKPKSRSFFVPSFLRGLLP